MDQVLAAYSAYPQSFRHMAPIPIAPLTAQALVGNFAHTQQEGCLASLRDQVLSMADGRCPYCDISDPFTLDHHLPRSRFPEFSVLATNLVALCDSCNRAKSDATPDIQVWPHPYFDELDVRILFGRIAGVAPVRVRFELDVSAVADPEVGAAIVEAHAILSLLKRFEREALEDIAALTPVVLEEPESDTARRRLLERVAAGREAVYGFNHWRAVAWRTLANDEVAYAESAWGVPP